MTPTLSIIVCTYCRPIALSELLETLSSQTCANFETLIVYAGGRESLPSTLPAMRLTMIPSRKGLPVQRNAGLDAARGNLVAFLDDDVTVDENFAANVMRAFEQPGMRDVGGLTGYDLLHYGTPLSLRYRVRRMLGYYPDRRPGALGLCGCTVPLSSEAPFSGFRTVGWLPGFCMIYRRDAILVMRFDERLPAYGAEDAAFSMAVGRRWRLVLWGDLRLRHHADPTSRCNPEQAAYGGSFSLSRSYWLRTAGAGKALRLLRYSLTELALDVLSFSRRPALSRLRMMVAKQQGLVSGVCSVIAR